MSASISNIGTPQKMSCKLDGLQDRLNNDVA